MSGASWPWVRRALGTALTLLVVGWLVGGVVGLVSPLVAMPLGAVVTALAGGAWAVDRVGGAGLGAALIGLLAAIGAAIEGHHAFVATTVEVVSLDRLESWDPRSSVRAVSTPAPLTHEQRGRASVSARVRSGKGTRTASQVATPIVEGGRVVAFFCGDERVRDGAFALSLAEWHGSAPELCDAAIDQSVKTLAELGRPVAPGARARVVKLFATEAELRAAHRLRLAVTMPLAMTALFAALVVIFRRRGSGG